MKITEYFFNFSFRHSYLLNIIIDTSNKISKNLVSQFINKIIEWQNQPNWVFQEVNVYALGHHEGVNFNNLNLNDFINKNYGRLPTLAGLKDLFFYPNSYSIVFFVDKIYDIEDYIVDIIQSKKIYFIAINRNNPEIDNYKRWGINIYDLNETGLSTIISSVAIKEIIIGHEAFLPIYWDNDNYKQLGAFLVNKNSVNNEVSGYFVGPDEYKLIAKIRMVDGSEETITIDKCEQAIEKIEKLEWEKILDDNEKTIIENILQGNDFKCLICNQIHNYRYIRCPEDPESIIKGRIIIPSITEKIKRNLECGEKEPHFILIKKEENQIYFGFSYKYAIISDNGLLILKSHDRYKTYIFDFKNKTWNEKHEPLLSFNIYIDDIIIHAFPY